MCDSYSSKYKRLLWLGVHALCTCVVLRWVFRKVIAPINVWGMLLQCITGTFDRLFTKSCIYTTECYRKTHTHKRAAKVCQNTHLPVPVSNNCRGLDQNCNLKNTATCFAVLATSVVLPHDIGISSLPPAAPPPPPTKIAAAIPACKPPNIGRCYGISILHPMQARCISATKLMNRPPRPPSSPGLRTKVTGKKVVAVTRGRATSSWKNNGVR